MMRLNRLTDYAIVLLARMAEKPDEVRTVPQLATQTVVQQPTVAKVLTALAKGGIVSSHRGVSGGYSLARRPADISVAEIITALEGPISLTACVEDADDECSVESLCAMSGNWNKVNTAIRNALEGVTLDDMSVSMIPEAFLTPEERASVDAAD